MGFTLFCMFMSGLFTGLVVGHKIGLKHKE